MRNVGCLRLIFIIPRRRSVQHKQTCPVKQEFLSPDTAVCADLVDDRRAASPLDALLKKIVHTLEIFHIGVKPWGGYRNATLLQLIPHRGQRLVGEHGVQRTAFVGLFIDLANQIHHFFAVFFGLFSLLRTYREIVTFFFLFFRVWLSLCAFRAFCISFVP